MVLLCALLFQLKDSLLFSSFNLNQILNEYKREMWAKHFLKKYIYILVLVALTGKKKKNSTELGLEDRLNDEFNIN